MDEANASNYDRTGAPIPCRHSDHYAADGLPLCKGGACKGWTVACGQGMIRCERHQPANLARLADALTGRAAAVFETDVRWTRSA